MKNLIIRNIRKNKTNYMLYFFTLSLIISLIYAFLNLAYSDDLLNISDSLEVLKMGITVLVILTIYSSSIIISHITKFMFLQRTKEFATYILLGIKRKKIVKILIMESIFLAIQSMIIGVLLGGFIVSIFSNFINIIFGRNIVTLHFFDAKAFIITVISVILILIFSTLKSAKQIMREQVVDLLYSEKKNEQVEEIKSKKGYLELGISVLFLLFSFLCFQLILKTHTNIAYIYILLGFFFLMASIFFIQKNISTIIFNFSMKQKNFIYRSKMLYFINSIKSKFNSKRRLIAIMSVMSTIAIFGMAIAIIFGGGYKENIKYEYPYDVTVGVDAWIEDYSDVRGFIQKKYHIKEEVSFYLYDINDQYVAIKLSDYNKIRTLLGYKKVFLEQNKFFIHLENTLEKEEIISQLKTIEILKKNGLKLDKDQISNEPMETYRTVGLNGYVLIINDSFFIDMQPSKSRFVASIKEAVDENYKDELTRYIRTNWKPNILENVNENITMNVSTKAWGIHNSLSGFLIIVFIGLYLCIIFIIYSSTIIGFESLSSISHTRKEMKILFYLGFKKKEIKSLINKNLFTFFYFPIMLPITIVAIIVTILSKVLMSIHISLYLILCGFFISIFIFVGIYTLFFFVVRYLFQKEVFIQANREL